MASAAEADQLAAGGWSLQIGKYPWVVGVCAIVALQAVLILRHEPFVDEWQALQIAVQSPDLRSLLANLRYEGHPPLWYLLLRGLSALVGAQAALPTASLALSLATQGLILFKAPFPRWLRFALALSEPLLFEYGTLSRSYTLGVALTFWAMAVWDTKRAFWLPLILLPAVESFFGLFSVAFLLLRYAERRLWWPAVAAWAAVSLVAAWTVIPAPDFVPVYTIPSSPLAGVEVLLQQFSIVMVPLQWGSNGPEWNSLPSWTPFLALWLPFAWLCFDQTRRRPLDRAILAGFFAVLLLIYAFESALANRHLMLMGVLLIALQWRQSLRGSPIRPFFRIWVCIGAVCGLATAACALAEPFDTAPAVAEIIEQKGLQHEHWVSAPAQHAQGVAAITGMLFEGIGANCMNDFVRWNAATTASRRMDFNAWVRGEAGHGRFYLVSQYRLLHAPVVEIAHVAPGYDGKDYYLYRVGSVHDPSRRALPRCVPGMNPLPPQRNP